MTAFRDHQQYDLFNNHPGPMFENDRRPPWLNWLFLAMFLWSSWTLAGYWFEQLNR